jgi:hypothetical protein
MTLSIMILSIMELTVKLTLNGTEQNNTLIKHVIVLNAEFFIVVLNVIILILYAECRYA